MWQISIFQFKGILWSVWIMYEQRIPAKRFLQQKDDDNESDGWS